MSRAVLALGSNLGDRLAHLQTVLDGLGRRVVAVSPVYESVSWGDDTQPDYLNAVIIAEDPEFGPWEWLRAGQRFEAAAGRVRDPANRHAARPLDVDVLTCAGQRSDDPLLTLPHPRAHQRAFVLRPWLDVEPAAVLDVAGEPRKLTEIFAALPSAEVATLRPSALTLRNAASGRQ